VTARELASLLGARKCGRNRWTARCPAHADRNPSLSIGVGRKAVVLRCQSQGCSLKDICGALGITVESLFYDSGKAAPELKGRLRDERRLERLDRRLGLVRWLLAIDRERRNYWLTAEARITEEIETLWWEVMPDQDKFEKVRRFEIDDYRNKRFDWFNAREAGLPHRLPGGHEPNGAGESAPHHAEAVRPYRVHTGPHQF
jgi:hypothetical protein